MKHHALSIGIMTALTFTAAAANAQLVLSDFASGDDGWTGIDVQGPPYDDVTRGPYSLVYQDNGGDPGGRVGTADIYSTMFSFSAPNKFLGNRSGYYHGTLHYELRFL